ncbi:MAG: T9SS type A sorting domain-containing protein [Bacteroidota bacterium]
MHNPHTQLIRFCFCFSLLIASQLNLWSQNVLQIDTTQFYRMYDANLPSGDAFLSPLTNLTNDTLALRWTIKRGPNFPTHWGVYVLDHNISFTPNITTSPFPTELFPGDSNLVFASGLIINDTPGCAEYWVILSNYEVDSIVYDSIHYVINANDPNCNLTSLERGTSLDFQVYPNPVADYFVVKSARPYEEIKCFDLMGRELYRWVWTPSERYELAALPSGYYWVYIYDQQGRYSAQKITKQ